MKRVILVSPDGKRPGTRVMLANRKGHILYDAARDRTKHKSPRRCGGTDRGGDKRPRAL